MPSPPQPGESKDQFIGRCIEYMKKEGKYPEKQGIAVCYSMWDKKDEMLLYRIDHYLNENIDMPLAEYIQKCMEIIVQEESTTTVDIDTTPTANKPKKKKNSLLRRHLQSDNTGV